MDQYAVPVLPSRDLYETLDFYTSLGFELRGSPIEKYRYLIIGRGAIELHFWDAPNVDPLATDAGCYIRVRDADALFREWQQAGVPTEAATGSRLVPPQDTDYGMREFALVDRSGNLLRVGSSLGQLQRAVTAFRASSVFRFESESLETAGRELRRLAGVARDAGFELETARVERKEPDDEITTRGTPYAPLDPE